MYIQWSSWWSKFAKDGHMSQLVFFKKSHMPKTLPLNKHVTRERGNDCAKVGDYKHKRWAWWGKLEGGGRHAT